MWARHAALVRTVDRHTTAQHEASWPAGRHLGKPSGHFCLHCCATQKVSHPHHPTTGRTWFTHLETHWLVLKAGWRAGCAAVKSTRRCEPQHEPPAQIDRLRVADSAVIGARLSSLRPRAACKRRENSKSKGRWLLLRNEVTFESVAATPRSPCMRRCRLAAGTLAAVDVAGCAVHTAAFAFTSSTTLSQVSVLSSSTTSGLNSLQHDLGAWSRPQTASASSAQLMFATALRTSSAARGNAGNAGPSVDRSRDRLPT